MLFIVENDSMVVEAATPEEAAQKAIWLFWNDPESTSITTVPHDPDDDPDPMGDILTADVFKPKDKPASHA